jgi:hypothetical protein
MDTLIETAKRNDVGPQARLADVLAGMPQTKLAERLHGTGAPNSSLAKKAAQRGLHPRVTAMR